MKNIVIVAKNNTSVAMVNGNNVNQYKVYTATNSKIAMLNALINVMTGIPANDNLSAETRRVIISSKSPILGLATDTWKDYIKTGKNAKGLDIPADELALWKEFAQLYTQKCFNVRFTTDQFIGKTGDARNLYQAAWEAVKVEAEKAVPVAQPQPQQQAPAQDPVAMIGLQIAEAAAKGDMATVTALTAALTALKSAGAQAPEEQAPVQEDYMEVDDMEFE